MIKPLYISFLFIILSIYTIECLGDPSPAFPVVIDNVQVIGNEKTKSYIILREIPYQFPDTLSRGDLLKIKNRIQNLFLFNRVELIVTEQGMKKQLIILVTESWYFFPAPLLFINEHDWSKISYGLQLSHNNFRGRNEKLNLGGWFGYNPSFYINYFNPWIDPNFRLILGTGISRNIIENKIFQFDERRFGFDLILGRKLTLNLDTQINFNYQQVQLPDEFKQYTVSKTGKDNVPSLSFQLRWDTRDLFEYPKKGAFLAYVFRRTGFNSTQPNFWSLVALNRQ